MCLREPVNFAKIVKSNETAQRDVKSAKKIYESACSGRSSPARKPFEKISNGYNRGC